jgi:hypothetical protein
MNSPLERGSGAEVSAKAAARRAGCVGEAAPPFSHARSRDPSNARAGPLLTKTGSPRRLALPLSLDVQRCGRRPLSPVPDFSFQVSAFSFLHFRGKTPSRSASHTRAKKFFVSRAEKIFTRKNRHEAEIFASRKYLCDLHRAFVFRFSEEKSRHRAFFHQARVHRECRTAMSTSKVTENFQFPPLMSLTGYNPISISCGQGSGHPHPVVVDNVSGSFGNFMSPGSFCRL